MTQRERGLRVIAILGRQTGQGTPWHITGRVTLVWKIGSALGTEPDMRDEPNHAQLPDHSQSNRRLRAIRGYQR